MTRLRRAPNAWLTRICALALLLVLSSNVPGAEPARWLLVDTAELTLTVFEQQRPQLTLYNLAIGRYGSSAAKRRGDNTTPLGRFRITRLQRDSAFHRFIGLSYPDQARAARAQRDGLITDTQYQAILAAQRQGKAPPQDTPLGGHIGIHGLGRADPAVHQTMNWTRGCIALTNQQIDTLLSWVRIGMPVEVR